MELNSMLTLILKYLSFTSGEFSYKCCPMIYLNLLAFGEVHLIMLGLAFNLLLFIKIKFMDNV